MPLADLSKHAILAAQFDRAFSTPELALGTGLSLIGEGGALIGAGSCADRGANQHGPRIVYEWQDGHSIKDLPPPLAPDWLVAAAGGRLAGNG